MKRTIASPQTDINPSALKKLRTECSFGSSCYRKNPVHFKEFRHSHLESIILEHTSESSDYKIPKELNFSKDLIKEQLNIINDSGVKSVIIEENNPKQEKRIENIKKVINLTDDKPKTQMESREAQSSNKNNKETKTNENPNPNQDNRKKIEDCFAVVAPKGRMKEKHAKAAPYFMFFTTITAAPPTHNQPLSITFQELLDPSLGKLKSSLQINFMIDLGWLLAHYYFAGYSNVPLTILYGEETEDLKTINKKRPNIDAHCIVMKNAFGKHHTKMSILCYEDGTLRVVVSTANLYIDDWENRTQGLWLSPACPKLDNPLDIVQGESPTGFKRSLLNYLNSYALPCLSPYVEAVKQADFSDINVFFIASIPGGHFDTQWGLGRLGSILNKYCDISSDENDKWSVIGQCSSIGSYGKNPKQWLTGDFLNQFMLTSSKNVLQTKQPALCLIYPSLKTVKHSHDNLLGGGCLPYSKTIHLKQPWLNGFLHDWYAKHSGRNKAMPHIKSYLRLSPDAKKAAFFLLTSANLSKSAWGVYNKGNKALRINSYEAGVLFIPKFVVNETFFSVEENDPKRVPIPYDLPPIPYTSDKIPWVQEYLMEMMR